VAFAPDGDGTIIRQTYEFRPRPGWEFLVRVALAPLWRRYMPAAVEKAARLAEQKRLAPRHEYTPRSG
jgi:hypothetical protein